MKPCECGHSPNSHEDAGCLVAIDSRKKDILEKKICPCKKQFSRREQYTKYVKPKQPKYQIDLSLIAHSMEWKIRAMGRGRLT